MENMIICENIRVYKIIIIFHSKENIKKYGNEKSIYKYKRFFNISHLERYKFRMQKIFCKRYNDSIQIIFGYKDFQKFVPEIEAILECICKYYNLQKDNILTPVRKREIIIKRQILMYFLKQHYGILYIENAFKKYIGFHHSNVLYAVRQIENLMCYDFQLKKDIENLKLLINKIYEKNTK